MKLKQTGGIFDEFIGGIPAGSLIYFSADPTIASEMVLYQLCAGGRKTYYFVTERNPKRVEADMKEAGMNLEEFEIIDLRKGKEGVSEIISILRQASDANVVIDTFVPFIGDESLMAQILEESADKDVLCFLCVPKGSCDEKISNRLANICDVFFDLRAERAGEEVVVKFAVPKLRGGQPLMRYMRLKMLASGVEIDTSRDIA
jgi:archaellum biogenesis ATPase FlaH